MQVRTCRLSPSARLPTVSQPGDVAADLHAAEAVIIPARGRCLVPTGLAMELPPGYRASIRSRSGLSLKHGIEAGAGLIDNQYRDAIGVLLYNHSDVDYPIAAGDRIAQICIERYEEPGFIEVDELSSSSRTAGWGSSGV
ncbi:MAG: dUTP diphosphatase [Candidatus Sericytochromatia bacterium]|nr:dUTP diphosphatase [Candidatus Sericytochromatia bacterium]